MWNKVIEEIIDYIEEHLDSKIHIKTISKLASCSSYSIERVFAFIFNMTIAEYIRLRRLSLAALELVNSDSSILDIAIKYGYGSHESFSRAFVNFHGVTPSAAKSKYTKLKFCKKAEIPKSAKTCIQIDLLNNQSMSILGDLKIRDVSTIPVAELGLELFDSTFINAQDYIHINGNSLIMSCPEENFCLQTKDTYTLPLKIDLYAATDSTNLRLLFGRGDVTLNWKYNDWNYRTNELMIHDIFTGSCYGYPVQGKIATGMFHRISWIIKSDFMALFIDGTLRLYNQYLPYIKELLNNHDLRLFSKIGISAAWGSTVTIKQLTIYQLI